MGIAYFISRGTDTKALADLQVALLSSAIGLGIIALYHLIRAPFLAYAEAMVGDSGAALPTRHGVFGIFVLALMIGGFGFYATTQPKLRLDIGFVAATEKDAEISELKQKVSELEHAPPQRNGTKTSNQPNPALPAILPPVQPATQLDRLTAINGRMTKADREPFSAALIDYSQALDRGDALLTASAQEGNKLDRAWHDGSIVQDFATHKAALLQIAASSKELAIEFLNMREKWKDYPEQMHYIFGDSPDNDGPNAITNAVQSYAGYIDHWTTIQNKEQRAVLDDFAYPEHDFQVFLHTFVRWHQDCEIRLAQMRDTIR